MIKIQIKDYLKKYQIAVASGVLVLALVFSLIMYCVNRAGDRRLFYFYSADTKSVATEARFINSNPTQGKVNAFIDDLLLGPMTNRYQSIFAKGTTVEFCRQEGDTLYVGLSSEALLEVSGVLPLKERVDLFRFNIVNNFTKINTVLIYVDGKSVWND